VTANFPCRPWTRERTLAAAAAVLLLAGVAVEAGARSGAADVALHHERVRRVADSAIPYSMGDWIGRDVEPAPSAVALLRPNVLLDRQYVNVATGEVATLVFVQCSDARDLIGHYPPKCYPAHGWTLEDARPRTWNVGGREIPGMRYRFRGLAGRQSAMVVDNFMVLPTGDVGRDMDAVDAVARDVRLRELGAAEVQVVTGVDTTDERRDEVVRELVAGMLELIATVGEIRHE
jgi:uncharacterized protein DUF3485